MIKCQKLKPIFLQLCFNFPYIWLGLNILVLLIFFFSIWIKGMEDPCLIQNFPLHKMEIIFQSSQLFLKFIFHSFHYLFQLKQLKVHIFIFFYCKGSLSRFMVMNQIPREHKGIRISTPRLANERKLDNKPLLGSNLLICHIDLQHKMIQMKKYPWYI